MPYGPFNAADKYLVLMHCHLQLELPERLTMLQKHGAVISITLPQYEHTYTQPSTLTQYKDDYSRSARRPMRYPSVRARGQRVRVRVPRAEPRSRSRSTMRARIYRTRQRSTAPPPQPFSDLPDKSKQDPYILSRASQLTQLSAKAFYAGI